MELKLGTIIKKLRTERGITQEELANKMGVSYQAVSKWETNTTTPDIAILPQIALFFGVSMDVLFSMNQDDYIERISKMIRDDHSITPENFV
ncbi:MAG: helix-turn-helix transcriptional regulator, partial [Eubacteriales bacterium]